MTERRRPETAFDQLVTRALKGAPPLGPCPDAGILAAYCDRTLSAAEVGRLDIHLASCARCQTQLAAIVSSDEDVVRPVTAWASLKTFLDWRWLAPLATAAAAVLAVWIVQPGSVGERQNVTPSGTPPEPMVAAPQPPAEPQQAEDALLPDLASERPSMELDAEGQRRAAAGEAPPATVDRLGNAAVPDERARAEKEELGRETRSDVAQEASPAAPALTARAATPNVMAFDEGMVIIPTPRPSLQYRVRATRIIERSIDGGVSWQTRVADAGGALLAGSAPAGEVCWIVGQGGLVWRTTDGQRWDRMPAPLVADLSAVEASDSLSATVTTASGEQYRTLDGGQTWTRD